MTILGKMLVFVVLVLSIAWNALVVNSYVARTNWQKRAAQYEKSAQEAADSANKMKLLLEEERAAAAEARQAITAQHERLYLQNQQLLKDRENLTREMNNDFVRAKGKANDDNKLQTNVEKLQTQVDNQERQIKEKDKQLTDTTHAAQLDRVAAEKARIDAAGRQQQAERLAVRVQQHSDELDEYKRRFGTIQPLGPGERRSPGVPSGFHGSVVRTEGTAQDLYAGRDVLVELTPGMDAGLRQGAILTVRRQNGATGKYLGTVTVVRADAKNAVGRFTPANPRAVRADDLPKAGDELVASTSNN
jgi:hypothetical protein